MLWVTMTMVRSFRSSETRSSTLAVAMGASALGGPVTQQPLGRHRQRGGHAHALLLAAREAQPRLVQAIFHLVPEGGVAEGALDALGQRPVLADTGDAQDI